ncbi:MAG: hypothetical protein IH984_14795 [Planctomycetes bacterium]|nr:hypothetical protein [Planctomycetota bacterium]
MIKHLRTILVFLLLGAIVNVAVAWGIVVARGDSIIMPAQFKFSDPIPPRWVFSYTKGTGFRMLYTFLSDDFGKRRSSPLQVARAPNWGRARVPPTREDYELGEEWHEYAHGWPWPSLFSRVRTPSEKLFPMKSEGAIKVHVWRSSTTATMSNTRYLPLYAIWRPFIANVAFYSTLIASLLILPGLVRRQILASRGGCAQCGYDLRGDFSAGCSECGWGREAEA